jgi:hypothetical protein
MSRKVKFRNDGKDALEVGIGQRMRMSLFATFRRTTLMTMVLLFLSKRQNAIRPLQFL